MARDAARQHLVVAVLSILLLSLLGAPPLAEVSAAPRPAAPPTPLTALEANWAAPDGNQFNQNYNPQNVINSSDAQDLGLYWVFPLPYHPIALASVLGGLGVDTAPLIVDGVVYAVTQSGWVYALNAANGQVIWYDLLPILPNSTAGQTGAGTFALHLHDGAEAFTTTLFGDTPTYWVAAPDHKVYAMNALDGAYELNFTIYTGLGMIAGSNPNTQYSAYGTSQLVIDQQRGVLITSMLSSSSNNAARCFYRGWNIFVTPPVPLWTSYCSPPQPGGGLPLDPNWDLEQVVNMTGAEIFYPGPAYDGGGTMPGTAVVNLKTLPPAVLNATLYNDWGYAPQSAHCATLDSGGSPGAVGAGWGAPWLIDEKTGVAYVNTGNKGPYTGECQPGPDLWASSVLALNDTTGQWIWGFQTSAHDEWDFDCSWQQVLGNETVGGVETEVLWKTCKNGYLYELDAATGNMIWAWTPPQDIMARCQYCFMHDPLNRTQMTEFFFNPSLADTLMYPSEFAGFENEFAYSPALNYIFTASQNVPALEHYIPFLNASGYGKANGFGAIAVAATAKNLDNSTVEAVNASTGQMLWTHFIPSEGYRGGLTTSGNVVYATLSSGDIQMINAQTGALIKDFYIGGPLNVLPSIGATSSGQMEVVFPITAGGVTWGRNVPGDIVALTLEIPLVTTTTLTTTAVSTVSTTIVSSVTTTAPSPPTTGVLVYGMVGVAVVFIVVAGYLALKLRKKPS
ncbi:MAG TPA: PQQ-binding-like beta-propeller repeat protein [Nitrososphaerales archaeon]|nr:PQQ-binding-like beta-propeller repeat protein [Nitrososphaerales archaeon]